ncbi:nucleic acid-binding, OB-fold protein [Artemisia annua]|uniref:Nucleic acid-binding, OB-fold protein n=1 Tax=Artemisia annua TaxID=35608 RepID=A0A2U1MFB2_ARTAN|nr:nucleic acid-binding, OB-fold protein [Artemisia annua]
MELTSDANAASKIMAKPVAPQRSLAYFADLNPTDNTKFIEARVYRRWTAMKVPSLIPTGFSCILLDKKGSAIQANADLKEKARFEHDLQPNCVYRIEDFGFEKIDGWGKTLDNDFTLCLGKHTRVDLLKDDEFPHHYFNFAVYKELGARLEKKSDADSNNVVMFTLWNEKDDSFEQAEYEQMRQPVVLAVSSCYLKTYGGQLSATSATCYYFNPPIEETSELLAAYNQDNAQVPQLEVQTERLVDWEQERTQNRVPLATLLQIDPNTQQRVLFTQDAMIVRIDTTYDWYYQKCDECGGKLDYGFIHGHCHPYGTQSTPQNRFAKPTGRGPPTLILQKIMDHPPALLPATAEGPSSPSPASASSEAASQITPPPTTPVTTENTPADIPSTISLTKTSIIRKQLFKISADEEKHTQTEPECPSSPPTIPVTTHMTTLKSTTTVEPTTNATLQQTERLVDWEQERTRNRVPLATLLQIDPNTQQFTQDAMIVRIDTTYDWYYQKCDECGGKLDYGFIHGHCHPYGTQSTPQNSYSFRIVITDGTENAVMTCFNPQTDGLIKNVDSLLQEVANKDPVIIPQQLLALQNTRHVFQFRFAKPTGRGPPTLILQKIMDHPPALLPATAEGPSSPPPASASSEAASQITPPPTTPVTTENTPADITSTISLTTTSIVRKQLFKISADEEKQTQTEPECPSSLPTIPVTTHMTTLKSTPTVEPTTSTDTKIHTPTIINLPATPSTKKGALKDTADGEEDPKSKKQKKE